MSSYTGISYDYQPTVVVIPSADGTFQLFPTVTAGGSFCDDLAGDDQLQIAHAIVDRASSIPLNWNVDQQQRMHEAVSDIQGLIGRKKGWRGATVMTFNNPDTYTEAYQSQLAARADAMAAEEALAEQARQEAHRQEQSERRSHIISQSAAGRYNSDDYNSQAAVHPRHLPRQQGRPRRQDSIHAISPTGSLPSYDQHFYHQPASHDTYVGGPSYGPPASGASQRPSLALEPVETTQWDTNSGGMTSTAPPPWDAHFQNFEGDDIGQ